MSRDQELLSAIDAAKHGMTAQLEQFFFEYRRKLIPDAGQFVADGGGRISRKVDASDLVQEALAVAFRDLRLFRGSSELEFFAWMRRILRTQELQFIRRHLAKRRDIRRDSNLPVSSLLKADVEPSPSSQAAANEVRVLLDQAMSWLSPGQREVIRLRHEQNLSFQEIGQRLGINVATARKRWSRAVAVLGDTLSRLNNG